MSTYNKTGLKIVLTYLVIWIAVIIMQMIMAAPYVDSSGAIVMTIEEELRLISLSNLSLYLTLFVLFIILLRPYLKEQIINTKNNYHEFIKTTLLGLTFLFIIVFVGSFILNMFGVTGGSENQDVLDSLVTAAAFDKISLVLFTVVFAPFVEEIVFRRAVFGFFEKISVPLAITVSGLLFGFIHVLSGDYAQLVIYGGLGLLLATVYYYSKKNIFTVIAIHTLYNLIVIISMFTI